MALACAPENCNSGKAADGDSVRSNGAGIRGVDADRTATWDKSADSAEGTVSAAAGISSCAFNSGAVGIGRPPPDDGHTSTIR